MGTERKRYRQLYLNRKSGKLMKRFDITSKVNGMTFVVERETRLYSDTATATNPDGSQNYQEWEFEPAM